MHIIFTKLEGDSSSQESVLLFFKKIVHLCFPETLPSLSDLCSLSIELYLIHYSLTQSQAWQWGANWNLSVAHVNPLAEFVMTLLSCIVVRMHKKEQMNLGRIYTSYEGKTYYMYFLKDTIPKII